MRLLPLSPRAEGAWERVIEADDALLSRYLAGEAIEGEDIARALGRGVRACALHPVYFGAALHDVGIDALLDAIVEHFPRTPAPENAPLGAYIYKVEWDGHDHKHAYVRVFEGSLDIRAKVAHVGHEEPVYVRGLRAASNGGFVPTGSIGAGDIGVLMDAPHVRCGDFLGREVALPLQGQTSQPLLTMGVTPDPAVGRPALLDALKRLTEEDPILQLSIHPQTEEISLRLYGLLQREIIEALLVERFGIHAAFTPARTLYKERPREKAFAERRISTRGNLHRAGIALTLEPAEGSGVEYVTAVSYGDLERSFQNAVEEGVRAALAEGLGNEVIGARATFVDMDYDSVTSTPADFRRLAPEVVRDALRQANLLRLEPWLRYELSAPLESQKRVLAAVNAMRASMESVLYGEDELRLRGEVPLDTSKGFSAALLSMTQGRGLFGTSFLEYRPVTATQRSGQ